MSITISRARTSGPCCGRTLRVLKKGGVFALNDEMKPHMYGDMEAFAQGAAGYGV